MSKVCCLREFPFLGQDVQVFFNGLKFDQAEKYCWQGRLPKNYPAPVSVFYNGISAPEDGRICQLDLREIAGAPGHYRLVIDQMRFDPDAERDWSGLRVFIGFFRNCPDIPGLDVGENGILIGPSGFTIGLMAKASEAAA